MYINKATKLGVYTYICTKSSTGNRMIIFKPTLQCWDLKDISSYNIINRQNAVLSCNSLSGIYMYEPNETPIGTL